MKTTPKIFLISTLLTIFAACNQNSTEKLNTNGSSQPDSTAIANDRNQISAVLDSFNTAAAKAEFERYFSYFADDAVFIGTDATENWDKVSFMTWAKPHFDKGKTWNFKSLQRHIYFDKKGNTAWFDELLDTQMKICRGSGVLTREGKDWKIQQYVLSMTIPNSQVDTVIAIKAPVESEIIRNLLNK
jgi:hypothetical protein